MSASFYRCPVFLLFVSAAWFPGEVSANTYSVNRLAEKWVPREFQSFAVWRNRDNDELLDVTPEMVEKFLEKGVWSFHEPGLKMRKKVEEPGGRFQFDNDPEYRKALEEYALKIATIRAEFNSLSGVEGAMVARLPKELRSIADRENAIFLWSLRSPRVLRLEWGSFMCHLTLNKEDAVTLEMRKLPEDPAPKPAVPEGKLLICRNFLPGTGPHQELPPKSIREFVASGRPIEKFEISTHLDLGVSTHWFGETRDVLPEKQGDRQGNLLIADVYQRGSFNAIFQDREGKLWRAKLLTDCHLRLDDSMGRRVVLEHPELLKNGTGRMPPEPKAADPSGGN